MNDKKIFRTEVKDFNLDHIFDCGQAFRWERQADGSYTGIAFGCRVNMALEYEEGSDSSGVLTITGADEKDFENIWYDYLDLGTDYGKIKRELEKDPVMAKAIEKGRGIRILKQDLWETTISFIISQNNNIPRIKGCIEKLAEFGTGGNLPTPEQMAQLTVEDLSPVRLGYRAKYLIATAKTVTEKGLPANYTQLLELTGVGPKVANCISLFGLGDMSRFPIDVWIKKAMSELYGFRENETDKMAAFAENAFGKWAGLAQQYIFYYIRQEEK